jgi:hypothetical protein
MMSQDISPQFVYILTNNSPKLEGIIKIGQTSKHPQIRANELSKQTSAIDKFIVEWYMEVPNSLLSEKILHNAFEDKRYNKEYFEIDLEEAIRISEELIFQHFKPFGNIEKYRRQKSSFGSVIVNNEKKLREW